jgi:hypothetical protein
VPVLPLHDAVAIADAIMAHAGLRGAAAKSLAR